MKNIVNSYHKCSSFSGKIIKKSVLVTGATGFLGAYIVRSFIAADYHVTALKRINSNRWRCRGIEEQKLDWIDIGNNNWEAQIQQIHPQLIIHSAWTGVDANNRNDWEQQIPNIELTRKLLAIAKNSDTSIFVGLGSQAEYGCFLDKVTENHPLNPTSAYGVLKCTCANMTKVICEENHIKWYWLRLFPLFGESESDRWLIPSIIKNIRTQKEMDFTPCEQQYAYLYAGDLAKALQALAESNAPSGFYNISSSEPRSLREIITALRDRINPNFQLNFGALPYRPNQTMYMIGNTDNIERYIGKIDRSDFWKKLNDVTDYYLNYYQNNE